MSYQLLNNIFEDTLAQLIRKQKTITRLFPTFWDRVEKVADNGGVHLIDEKPNLWIFSVASGTDKDKSYKIYVEFPDYVDKMKQAVKDIRVWNSNKSDVDLRKLGAWLFQNLNFKFRSDDPSFQYWGPAYILTKRKSIYGEEEPRPPIKRNPRQYGAYDKHTALVIKALPMYVTTLGGMAKRYYKKEFEQAKQEAQKEFGKVQNIAKELKKRQEQNV